MRDGNHHQHHDIFIKTIKQSFNEPKYSDITLKSRNSLFYCHKIIISSHGGWTPNIRDINHLDCSKFEDTIVKKILKWFYLGHSLVSHADSQEFVIKILEASKVFDLNTAEKECINFLQEMTKIRTQIKNVAGVKKGPVQRCGFCEGCRRPDCGICRQCVDKVKFGGPGRLKEKCRMKTCSHQIQTRNLRKLNKESIRPFQNNNVELGVAAEVRRVTESGQKEQGMLETDHYVAIKDVKEPGVLMADTDLRTVVENEATEAEEETTEALEEATEAVEESTEAVEESTEAVEATEAGMEATEIVKSLEDMVTIDCEIEQQNHR